MKRYKKLWALCSPIPVCKSTEAEHFLIPLVPSSYFVYTGYVAYALAALLSVIQLWAQWWLIVIIPVLLLGFLRHDVVCRNVASIAQLGFDGAFFIVSRNGCRYTMSLSSDCLVTGWLVSFELIDSRVAGKQQRWPIVVHRGCMAENDFHYLRQFLLRSLR